MINVTNTLYYATNKFTNKAMKRKAEKIEVLLDMATLIPDPVSGLASTEMGDCLGSLSAVFFLFGHSFFLLLTTTSNASFAATISNCINEYFIKSVSKMGL